MVSINTQLALDRQKRVVVGVVLALRSLTSRIMEGCWRGGWREMQYRVRRGMNAGMRYDTYEWHDTQCVFDLVSGDASGVCLL